MRRGLLFINIGSPDSTSVSDVRTYLRGFLTDRRIISLPYIFRHALVSGIVVPFRAPKSAERYKMIWTDEGSPLDVYTQRLSAKVGAKLSLPVYVTMRYKRGDTAAKLAQIQKEGIDEVILIPLYPQYAMSSFESSVAHVHEMYTKGHYTFKLQTLPPYYNHSGYIDATVEQISQKLSPDEHLILSYHGIPMEQVEPYRGQQSKDYLYQCFKTSDLITTHPLLQDRLLSHETLFQSRFDSRKWLSPTLENRLKKLPSEGVKKVIVFSPTFICDCLETIEEIGIMGEEIFKQNGGEGFTFVSSPNDSTLMVDAIADMVYSIPPTPLDQWISAN